MAKRHVPMRKSRKRLDRKIAIFTHVSLRAVVFQVTWLQGTENRYTGEKRTEDELAFRLFDRDKGRSTEVPMRYRKAKAGRTLESFCDYIGMNASDFIELDDDLDRGDVDYVTPSVEDWTTFVVEEFWLEDKADNTVVGVAKVYHIATDRSFTFKGLPGHTDRIAKRRFYNRWNETHPGTHLDDRECNASPSKD